MSRRTPAPTTMPVAPAVTAVAVRAEQIATLYRQSLPVLLSNLVNATIVSATLWNTGPRRFLLAWTSAMALMTLVRIALRRWYWRARLPAEAAPRWGRRYVAGSLVAGLLWGLAGWVLFDPAQPVAPLLITFVIGGMGAGAAATISCHLPAFFAYMVPSLAPLVVHLFTIPGRLYVGMGAMSLVYVLAISAVARITNRALAMAFRLRFENEVLVERLSSTQLILEESNQTLERRVAERSQELERQGEALRNAQRLEAVGRLAGGIAHDFNNLLTIVLANASKLLKDEGVTPANRTALEDVRGAASRGADLIRQLLTFSRRQRTTPQTLDLNRVVRDIERLVAHLLGEPIALEVLTTSAALPVRLDASQLEQVLVNLVTNARDAMPAGGTITVETSEVVVADGGPHRTPGRYAALAVSDTGTGMDEETQRRAFDPFFTTKDVGQGTGLGLATVHGIVHQSGGQVSVQSEADRGTRIEILLPLVDEQPPTKATLRPIALPAVAPATILVAEDEALVRSVIALGLEAQRHRVLTAQDGEEALAILEAEPAIDLVITDVVMARMGGPELARRARQIRPGVRLLFISGYSWESDLPQAEDAVEVLEKPFTTEQLLQRVAAVLARAGH